jgi:hypothetical protein
MDIKIAIQDHSKLYVEVNSRPKNGLRLFKSTLSSCCGAPAERDTPFPKLFIYALLHSYLLESPAKELSHETWRENHSLSMMAHVDRRPTYSWGWHGSPNGSFMTCYYYPYAMQPSA